MKNKFENLLLLEFMVNKVVFYENEYKIDKSYLCRLGDTCIQIKFKGACLLEITGDENTVSEVNDRGHRVVKLESGKSCLLSTDQLMEGCNNEVCLCVCRKTPPGDSKDYFSLGDAKVSLEPIFKALKKASCPPANKSMRVETDIKDRECNISGKIEFFVRVTEMGKNIVTMFQLGAGESSFYFKGTDQQAEDDDDDDEADQSCSVCPGSKMESTEPYLSGPSPPRRVSVPDYRSQYPQYPQPPPPPPFDPYREGPTFNQPMPQNMRTWPVIGPCRKSVTFPPYQQPYQTQTQLPFQQQRQSMGMGGAPTQPFSQGGALAAAAAQRFPQSPELTFPPLRDEDYEKLDGEYKEISAEVNGYEVKIKLLRRPKKTAAE